ncbi:MAG: carboxypeptidase-like regulatory domain-containing protein [Bryobacteraceae bacterium]
MRPLENGHRLFLFAVLIVSTCLAQQPTAQITGIITDASGAVIPEARISATNINTGVEAVTQSNESGNYVFSNVPIGTYKLSVQKQGFSTVERQDIALAVGQTARIDFSLAVGSTTETVEIHASPPLLEAASASVGQLIESKAVSDLPLNGRNFLQLAKLSSGVLEAKPGDRATEGGSFIANGVRAQLNNFLLDGVDNNAKIVDQQNSSPVVIQPSVDAVQEFRVETNNTQPNTGTPPVPW